MFSEIAKSSPAILISIVVLYFLAIVLDWIWSEVRHRPAYSVKDVAANAVILITGLLSRFLFAGWVVLCLTWFSTFAPFHFPENALGFFLSFLLSDFLYYWQHRLKHIHPFFWAFHVVHHSSKQLNFTTGFRLSWFDPLIKPFLYAPAVLIGAHPSAILASLVLNLLFQFWVHNTNIGKLGFLEGIINTPSAHRVHHGRNKNYLDRNFGGVLLIWDRIFGTYVREREEPEFGITGDFESYNPLRIQLHGFADFFRGKKKTRG
ncbi:MAG: sterol desaturase family protein [Verrucomicrobiales bacterium]|nr:sterol desaturase family protein [Verrucomicrobiales bacterium]